MNPLAPLLAVALAAPAIGQCEIARLDPADPLTVLARGGALGDGLAAVPGYSGQVAVFDGASGDWLQVGSFQAQDAGLFTSVHLASRGDAVIVGMPDVHDGLGQVLVYERSLGWSVPAVLTPGVPQAYDTFGADVAVAGDTLVVGSPMSIYDVICGPGKAFVFERVGAQWVQTAEVHPHDFAFVMLNFGQAVDTDGSTVVVGASNDDQLGGFAGAVYVYERDATGWVETAKLLPSDAAAEPHLGAAVAVDGDVLMAASEAGAVYVFERQGAAWVETQVLVPGDAQPGDGFGASLALAGDRAVIGAPLVDGPSPDTGAFYVYERASVGWVRRAKVTADDAAPLARFGTSVSLDGDLVLWTGTNQDHARVVTLEGGGLPYCPAGPSSTGAPARLQTDGCASVSAGVTFRAEGLPDTIGLFVYGPASADTPFGNGRLCVAAPYTRSPLFAATGVATWTPDLSLPPHDQITPGSTWKFQAVFRDPAAGGSGVELSNGLSVTFQP